MMPNTFRLTDVVPLLRDVPSHGLRRSQVGTVVERYRSGRFEVEFADAEGQIVAMATLPGTALLRLSYEATRNATNCAHETAPPSPGPFCLLTSDFSKTTCAPPPKPLTPSHTIPYNAETYSRPT